MRIAQVCPRYYPSIGGVETCVKEVSERLVEVGFEVDVLTTDSSGKLPDQEIIKGVTVNRFRSWAPRESYYFSGSLKKYLIKNSNNFDIVHAHSYHAFPALYAAQSKNKNKLVFTPHYHGTGHTFFRSVLQLPYKFLGRKILEKADKIICVSRYEKSLIREKFDVNEEKVVVIANGVNLKEFGNYEKRKKNFRTILTVGRLEKYKGMQHLIKVMPKLDQDIFLEIVGEGPYRESLVRLIGKLDLDDRVKFFQDLPRTELLRKYADADVFVLLSEHEAFGLSVAEALAAKTPCILANASALREWVDEQNCFGVNHPIEIDALAWSINKVIGREVNLAKVFDWNEVTEKVTEVYKDFAEI